MTVLAVSHLAVRSGPRTLLHDVNLSLAPGESGSIIGASGCGKSLLVRALCGLHPCDGEVVVDGVSSSRGGWDAVRGRLGVLLGAPGLVDDLAVEENVGWRLRRAGVDDTAVRSRVHALLAEFGLADAAARLPSELSGGMQRRVALARALVHQPPVLLLDDPTAGLDPITSASVVAFILEAARTRGTAVLWTTHDLHHVAGKTTHRWIIRDASLRRLSGGPADWTTELAA